jgi:hypothetical protein
MGVPIRDLLINAERFRLFARQKRRIQLHLHPILTRRGKFLAESSVCVFFTRILTPAQHSLLEKTIH